MKNMQQAMWQQEGQADYSDFEMKDYIKLCLARLLFK